MTFFVILFIGILVFPGVKLTDGSMSLITACHFFFVGLSFVADVKLTDGSIEARWRSCHRVGLRYMFSEATPQFVKR